MSPGSAGTHDPSWARAARMAALPGAIVVAGIAVGVAVESYRPQQLAYLVGGLIAIGFYIRATRKQEDAATAKRLMWINLGLILLLGIVNQLYEISNQPIGKTHSVEAGIDRHVPIVPSFVVPYLGIYAYTVFSFAYMGVLARHLELRTLLCGLVGSTAVGLLTFVTFQTYVPPPDEFGPEPFASMIHYTENQLFDGNFYSAFPSLHCAYAMVLAIAWGRLRRPALTPCLIVFSVLIILATQFLHQHFVLDLIYGVVLAVAVHAVAWWLGEWRPRQARAARHNQG